MQFQNYFHFEPGYAKVSVALQLGGRKLFREVSIRICCRNMSEVGFELENNLSSDGVT